MTDQYQGLEIPDFLRRPPDGLTHAQRLAKARRRVPTRVSWDIGSSKKAVTQGQQDKLKKLGWSADQCHRIDYDYANLAIEKRLPPHARFGITYPKLEKKETTK